MQTTHEDHEDYDGYDDFLNAVTFDYTGDLYEDDKDYDREVEIPKWMRV